MRSVAISGLVVAALAACAPAVPDSGVGFDDYQAYLRAREAQLSGSAPAPAPAAPLPPPAGFDPARVGAAIDAAESGTAVAAADPPAYDPNDPNRPRGNAPLTIAPQSGEMVHAVPPAGPAISDEQDFAAVAARETIESDAARRARQAAQYTVVPPTPLPERSDKDRPNIVAYALATTNDPGQPLYRRSSIRFADPAVACARYNSSDLAQEAFLAHGGPERDSRGLDPDGDGFACDWDPRPFRLARQ